MASGVSVEIDWALCCFVWSGGRLQGRSCVPRATAASKASTFDGRFFL